jgi:multidrug efflux system membrane fusion protein
MDPQRSSGPLKAKADSRAVVSSESRSGMRHRWGRHLLALLGAGLVLSLLVAGSLRGQSSGAKASRGAPRAIPVVGASARVGDLGLYQTGLGTVTPVSTVTVRSRVDGQLINVAYREGQFVHEGDLLAQIDPRPFQVQLLQAEAQLAKDEAALKNAKIDLERYKILIGQDSIPQQQLDTQVATVDQTEAAIKSDQAQVENAKLNLTYSRITAPTSGIVGLRLVDPGNIVPAADASGLVVITQLRPIAVVFTIPADHLQPVLQQRKDGHELAVEAWDRDLQHKLATGSLLAIDNQIDPTTGTVRIKALFPNDDSALYPNQFVNARLLVDTLRQTVIVPTAAIQRGPQSTYVYVVKSDNTVEMRNVDVQLTQGDDTSLRQGVSAGEVVVIDGVDKLQPGSLVSVAKAGNPRQRNS